jgi:tRNA G46 methylase TrmB
MAVYFGFMGCLMYYYSKVIKLKDDQNLLDSRQWTGNEKVLDIGFGRGLLLINAAQRLITGKAVGIKETFLKGVSFGSFCPFGISATKL